MYRQPPTEAELEPYRHLRPLQAAHLPVEIRFWLRIDRTPGLGPKGECWEWRGFCRPSGHAAIQVDRKAILVHRYSYFYHTGTMPVLHVLHGCDNPPCVNPRHLREGTQADNVRDRDERNRRIAMKGSEHPNSKLTEADIPTIRALIARGETRKAIARRYGVDDSLIYLIDHKKAWVHVV